MQLPAQISILTGREHVISFVNRAAQEYIGDRNLIGKTAREAFPELEGQGFFEILDNVFETRSVFVSKAMPANVILKDVPVQLYADVTYLPLINEQGDVEGIISFTYDVTEAVVAKIKLQEIADQLQQAYDDLEIKVKFRNLELEKINRELEKKLKELSS